VRADAHRQYLKPVAGRSNLTVVTHAKTLGVNMEKGRGQTVARGVTFSTNGPDSEKHSGEPLATPVSLYPWQSTSIGWPAARFRVKPPSLDTQNLIYPPLKNTSPAPPSLVMTGAIKQECGDCGVPADCMLTARVIPSYNLDLINSMICS
jgi:hypothetical protein